MADKSTQLVLDALTRAVADPAGQPLFGNKTIPGLFAASGPAKVAAQRCKEEDFLRVVRTETRGKNEFEICALTEKGLAHLISQTSPREVLEDLVHAVEGRREQLDSLSSSFEQTRATLDALKAAAEKVLAEVVRTSPFPTTTTPNELWEKFQASAPVNGNGTPPAAKPSPAEMQASLERSLLALLDQWNLSGAMADYPLPELYNRACQTPKQYTLGQFHDALRRLHESAHIYLHPWAGPLYDMPEPAVALLVGHEIAYYASIRR